MEKEQGIKTPSDVKKLREKIEELRGAPFQAGILTTDANGQMIEINQVKIEKIKKNDVKVEYTENSQRFVQ